MKLLSLLDHGEAFVCLFSQILKGIFFDCRNNRDLQMLKNKKHNQKLKCMWCLDNLLVLLSFAQ